MIAEEKKATEGLEMLWMETENLKREAVGAKQAGYALVPAGTTPDPEVADRATRRRFPAEYKLRILKQADACTDPGSLGALLRREGLYASNLTTWRRQREQGVLSALAPKKRGRKETVRNPLIEENEKLRKDNERLRERLRRAEIIMDVQKKVSQMLGASLEGTDEGGND